MPPPRHLSAAPFDPVNQVIPYLQHLQRSLFSSDQVGKDLLDREGPYVYTGCGGLSLALLKLFLAHGDIRFLNLSDALMDLCTSAISPTDGGSPTTASQDLSGLAESSERASAERLRSYRQHQHHPDRASTFYTGDAGILSIASVLAIAKGMHSMAHGFISRIIELSEPLLYLGRPTSAEQIPPANIPPPHLIVESPLDAGIRGIGNAHAFGQPDPQGPAAHREDIVDSVSSELLYGRSGWLQAASFVNFYGPRVAAMAARASAAGSGSGTGEMPPNALLQPPVLTNLPHIPAESMRPVLRAIIASGRDFVSKAALARNKQTVHPLPPLMWRWHTEQYLGAAHGVAGICEVLLDHFALLDSEDDREDVLQTLKFLTRHCKFPSGNFFSHLPDSPEDVVRDRLVQWCHGSVGVSLTFAKAWSVCNQTKVDRYQRWASFFLSETAAAAESVWERSLEKKLSLCHGIAGGVYTFLALHRVHSIQLREKAGCGEDTSNIEALARQTLSRAQALVSYMVGDWSPSNKHSRTRVEELIASGHMHGGDSPLSLFEGLAGVAWAIDDVLAATAAYSPPGLESSEVIPGGLRVERYCEYAPVFPGYLPLFE